jgi:hypothetical protein
MKNIEEIKAERRSTEELKSRIQSKTKKNDELKSKL